MPRRIAYLRATPRGASTDDQLKELGGQFDVVFIEPVLSSGIPVRHRLSFGELLAELRSGDELHVSSIDRLGRDAIDVERTLRTMRDGSVSVFVQGLGQLTDDLARVVDVLIAQLANAKRAHIVERCDAGREIAHEALKRTGRTHKGAVSMGRRLGSVAVGIAVDPGEVRRWRAEFNASIAATAEHWGISTATVKRYCNAASNSVEA